jgi:hypothetical protein
MFLNRVLWLLRRKIPIPDTMLCFVNTFVNSLCRTPLLQQIDTTSNYKCEYATADLTYIDLFIYFNLQKWRNAFTKHIHTGKLSQYMY